MQIFKYKFENLNMDWFYGSGVRREDVLYFDIETTGLSREKHKIYLIGCGYYTEAHYDVNAGADSDGFDVDGSDSGTSNNNTADLNIIQWFSENDSEEPAVIQAFVDFAESFSTLINYNGHSFDLPFTTARAKKYNIETNFVLLDNIDLYTYVKPYKKLLGLNDIKQKTLEQFLKVKRTDTFSGEELIDVYKKYISGLRYGHSDKKALDSLLLHNMEDVKNMHYLLPLLEYKKLGELELCYVNHTVSEYNGYNSIHRELIITCTYNIEMTKDFTSIVNIDSGTYALSCTGDKINIRIPVKKGILSYYFENYKDYYYLPNENMCVLKSVAEGVAKENRENATRENCKVSLDSEFIYAFGESQARKFKSAYNSKFEYIRLDDFEAMTGSDKTEYVNSFLTYFK